MTEADGGRTMAMYIPSADALFVHIPKTGGSWITAVLEESGLGHRVHSVRADVTVRHGLPADLPEARFRFLFVRHPVSWYESWWKYQAGRWIAFEQDRWHPQRMLQPCAADDFGQFVRNCLEREPAYVTRLYEWYVGPPEWTEELLHRVRQVEKGALRRFYEDGMTHHETS